jgi:hypothetical protein
MTKEFHVRARNRKHRCYELALKGILQEGAEGFLLIHGRKLLDDRIPISHAWLFDPTTKRIYDAVEDRWYPETEYPGVADCTYTMAEAAKLAVENNNSGPWHNEIRALLGEENWAQHQQWLADNRPKL